jgi:uncharacterized protein (TIGR02147 family)
MRPYVFEFENYRDFLREMLKWWASQDEKYSLRWFSKRLGFSSPSMLSMALSGQRKLPLEKLTLLADALHLLTDEVDYLRIIYDIDHCGDERERERLMSIKRNHFQGGAFNDLSPDSAELYDHWYLPAIRELVALQDFKADPFWISTKLGISPIEARDGLITLMRIGLVVGVKGRYERAVPSIQPKIPPASMMNYTKFHIRKSVDMLALSRNNRYANTLTVAVSQKTLAKIPEILSRVIAEIDSLAEQDNSRVDLIQVNVQFYSVSEFAKIERSKSMKSTRNDESKSIVVSE